VRVLFETYPWAFVTPGGGERQLVEYAAHLGGHGVQVVLHDHWHPDLTAVDAVHYFSCVGGSIHFCNFVKEIRLPLVVSSSLWIEEKTAHLYPIDEIRSQLALADVIVPNSLAEADQLARILQLPRDRFIPVMNGVRPHFAAADPATFRKQFNINGPFVLTVGNVERRKNQLNLIRALAEHALPLVIIGRVRESMYAERVLSEGGARVRFVGPLDHDDPLLASAYAACAVFALPSMCETPGLAALEAAVAGAPLVVTQIGSAYEYFGHRCCYVDPVEPRDIARGIDAALATGPCPGLSAFVLENFAWPVVTTALPNIYRIAKVRRDRRSATF
jgi:glycosyltransferase involved in cell wall biosynthesis